MSEVHDFSVEELVKEELIDVEICNPASYYFGESFYLNAKAYALDKAWYRCTKYGIQNNREVSLWFCLDELEFKNQIIL